MRSMPLLAPKNIYGVLTAKLALQSPGTSGVYVYPTEGARDRALHSLTLAQSPAYKSEHGRK